MPATTTSPSRRALLLTGLTLAATGCELDPRADPAPVPAPTSGAPTTASTDGDVELLDEARLAIRVARAQLGMARRNYPSLRRTLAPLGRLHTVHLETLSNAGEHSEDEGLSPDPMPADDPALALRQVRTAELALQRSLARACGRAASGSFARMLASMSAGVAAHVAALADEVPA